MIPALCLCKANQTRSQGWGEGSSGGGERVLPASGLAPRSPVSPSARALGARAGRVCTPRPGGVSGPPPHTPPPSELSVGRRHFCSGVRGGRNSPPSSPLAPHNPPLPPAASCQ